MFIIKLETKEPTINNNKPKPTETKDFLIIINYGKGKKLTSFNFEQSNFNLNKYKTKTTVTPKIQETDSEVIIKCLKKLSSNINNKILIERLNCQKSFLKNLVQEIYKRTILPLYIPILCIIASLVVLKSSNNDKFKNFKIKVFLGGIIIIILERISSLAAIKLKDYPEFESLKKEPDKIDNLIMQLQIYLVSKDPESGTSILRSTFKEVIDK